MSETLQNIHGGVIYLYEAFTRREFFENLEIFFSEVFEQCAFSVVVPSGSSGCRLEFSTVVDPGVDGLLVARRDLDRILDGPTAGSRFSREEVPLVALGSANVPVHEVQTLRDDDGPAAHLLFHSPRRFAAGREELFGLDSFVFDHVGMAYLKIRERDQLRRSLHESQARLEAIRRIGACLGSLDLDVLLSQIIEVCLFLTEAQVGSIRLSGPVDAEIEWGLPSVVLDGLMYRDGRSIATAVVESGETILIEDYASATDLVPLPIFNVGSLLCVPLVAGDRVLGTINLVSARGAGRQLSETDRIAISTISSLAGSAIENARLHEASLEKEKIEANLKIAQSIQEGMYPEGGLDLPGYDIAAFSQSCDETGGDYHDFIPTEDAGTAVAIGDASGHGIAAALVMVAGRSNLRALLSVRSDLQEVMRRLNQLMECDMDLEHFMTLFLGLLDPSRHRLTYVNAGHDTPLLYRAATGGIETLESTGIPLGMFPGGEYSLETIDDLSPGDVLLLSTDGVWELASASGERLGKERLAEEFRSCAHRTPREIIDRVLTAVRTWARGALPRDDMTLIVIRCLPAPDGPQEGTP